MAEPDEMGLEVKLKVTRRAAQDWRDEHTQLVRANRRKLWFKILSFCLLVHDLDPYAIFKVDEPLKRPVSSSARRRPSTFVVALGAGLGAGGDAKRRPKAARLGWQNNSLFGRAELRLEPTSADERRRRWTRRLKIFTIYHMAKQALISVTHHTLMRHDFLVPKNQSRPLVSRETTELLADHVGLPFYSLKDISLTLFTTGTIFCAISMLFTPAYYERRPLNIASLRFVLGPCHELRRVDASIREKLNALSESLRVYAHRQADHYRQEARRQACLLSASGNGPSSGLRRRALTQVANKRALGERDGLHGLAWREQQYCQRIEAHLHALRNEPSELERLRPGTFSPDFFFTMVSLVRQATLSLHLNYLVVWLVISVSTLYSAYSYRCAPLDCNPFHLFTWKELLVVFESLFGLAINCLSCGLNLTLFVLLTANQLELIKSIRVELLACQRAISNFVRGRAALANEPSGLVADSKGLLAVDEQRDRLNRLMLKSIAYLAICDRELRDNARCITEQTVPPATWMCSAIFLAAVNAQFKLPESSLLRWFVVGVIWLSVNMVAVSCANTHARVLDLHRQLWSILAASSHLLMDNYYQQEAEQEARNCDDKLPPSEPRNFQFGHRGGSLRFRQAPRKLMNGKCCSFVADSWIKFVYSVSSNVEQHCSSMLNMELNYQTIIEANFFSIFIYSLTLSHDR